MHQPAIIRYIQHKGAALPEHTDTTDPCVVDAIQDGIQAAIRLLSLGIGADRIKVSADSKLVRSALLYLSDIQAISLSVSMKRAEIRALLQSDYISPAQSSTLLLEMVNLCKSEFPSIELLNTPTPEEIDILRNPRDIPDVCSVNPWFCSYYSSLD